MIRVLVAEDSPTIRALLVAILRAEPGLQVVGEARNGAEAVELTVKLRPDLVTMDIQMPQLDGFAATRRIMIEAPTPILIVSASIDLSMARHSLEALGAGALGVIATPQGPLAPGHERGRQKLVELVRALAGVKVVRRYPQRESPPPLEAPVIPSQPRQVPVRLVAIAASTGGPAVLAEILGALPADFPAPILVVQHISAGFAPGLAGWLGSLSALRVKVAEHDERAEPGAVYVAPDGVHLGIRERRISLFSGAARGGFRPSASHLFETAASAYGRSCGAVVLTGMGVDGAEGLHPLKAAGGSIIVQDEETSVVFGMPGAVVQAGLAEAALPPTLIVRRLMDWVAHSERPR